jgi:Methyltransferase domain
MHRRPSPRPGTRCRHYHGIDLSAPALELAAKNMASATFEVELDHEDFVEALIKRPEPANAAWCSLSMHHLPTEQKRRLFEAIRAATPLCMIYEPTLQPGESRDEYLERFRRVNRAAWSFLAPEEWAQINHHVATCDLPETAALKTGSYRRLDRSPPPSVPAAWARGNSGRSTAFPSLHWYSEEARKP